MAFRQTTRGTEVPVYEIFFFLGGGGGGGGGDIE